MMKLGSSAAARSGAFRITSAVPGRIRLKLAPEARSEANRLAEALRSLLPEATVQLASPASILLTYPPHARDVAAVSADIERRAAQVLRNRGMSSLDGALSKPRTESNLSLVHNFPGRVRLYDPRLRRRPEIAIHLHSALAKTRGINDVRVLADDGYIVLRYDPAHHEPDQLAETTSGHIRKLLGRPAGFAEIRSSHDLAREERKAPNPLIAATAAVALASIETAPPVLVGTALAAAAMPILARALKGAKSGCMVTEQLDLITVATLAARGDMLTSGMLTWLIGLTDMLKGRSGLQAQRAVEPVIGAGHLDAGEAKTAHRLAERVKHAPISDTRVQAAGQQMANELSVPLAVTAAMHAISTRDILSFIGLIKPRCEYESGMSRFLPTSVLASMTGAAREGVLFSGGRSVERLAEADAVVVAESALQDVHPHGLALLLKSLADRGVRRIVLPSAAATLLEPVEEQAGQPQDLPALSTSGRGTMIELQDDLNEAVIEDLRLAGRAAAFVTGELESDDSRMGSNMTILVGGGAKVDNPFADIVIRRLGELPRSIDLAKEATDLLNRNNRILAGAATLNFAADLFKLSQPPVGTLIRAAATATISSTALKPLAAATGDR